MTPPNKSKKNLSNFSPLPPISVTYYYPCYLLLLLTIQNVIATDFNIFFLKMIGSLMTQTFPTQGCRFTLHF